MLERLDIPAEVPEGNTTIIRCPMTCPLKLSEFRDLGLLGSES